MLLDASGRPAGAGTKTSEADGGGGGALPLSPQPGTALAFFAAAQANLARELKSGSVPFGQTHEKHLADMVAGLWATMLAAPGRDGRAYSILGSDVSDAHALSCLQLVAASLRALADQLGPKRPAEGLGVGGVGNDGPGAQERQRARILEAVALAGDPLRVWEDDADPGDTRARALLLWTTLARSLLGAVVSQPQSPPPQIVAELVWLTTEAQLLAAAPFDNGE